MSDQDDAYRYTLNYLERRQRGAYQIPGSVPPLTSMPPASSRAPAPMTHLDPRQVPSELMEPAMDAGHPVELDAYEELFPPDNEPPAQAEPAYELHVQERAEPVGFVTVKHVIRDPQELAALACSAGLHGHQVKVELLTWPYEHVANLCTDCLAQLPPEEIPSA